MPRCLNTFVYGIHINLRIFHLLFGFEWYISLSGDKRKVPTKYPPKKLIKSFGDK